VGRERGARSQPQKKRGETLDFRNLALVTKKKLDIKTGKYQGGSTYNMSASKDHKNEGCHRGSTLEG